MTYFQHIALSREKVLETRMEMRCHLFEGRTALGCCKYSAWVMCYLGLVLINTEGRWRIGLSLTHGGRRRLLLSQNTFHCSQDGPHLPLSPNRYPWSRTAAISPWSTDSTWWTLWLLPSERMILRLCSSSWDFPALKPLSANLGYTSCLGKLLIPLGSTSLPS